MDCGQPLFSIMGSLSKAALPKTQNLTLSLARCQVEGQWEQELLFLKASTVSATLPTSLTGL